METFSTLLAFCEGNPSVTGGFPLQRPVTRSFAVFFDLRLNKRLNKQSRRRWFETLSCSLWRHGNVMCSLYLSLFGRILWSICGHHRGCLYNAIFSDLELCAACWALFMCHHELWPTSGSHRFSSLNCSLGFAGGKHYQKITIPFFRLVLFFCRYLF